MVNEWPLDPEPSHEYNRINRMCLGVLIENLRRQPEMAYKKLVAFAMSNDAFSVFDGVSVDRRIEGLIWITYTQDERDVLSAGGELVAYRETGKLVTTMGERIFAYRALT